MRKDCPWCYLTLQDEMLAREILGLGEDGCHTDLRKPDLVIAPDGQPYIFRWHLTPRSKLANVYFHIQVANDPERPLHDHPWDNTSVILSGGYDEIWNPNPPLGRQTTREFRTGDVIFRFAHAAHRIILPPGIEYAMTLFSTGPKVREWGFWYPDGWRSHAAVTRLIGNKSIHVEGSDAQSR